MLSFTPFFSFRPEGSEGSGAGVKDSRRAKLRTMFEKLAGADREIDSEELQDMLTASLSKGTFACLKVSSISNCAYMHVLCTCYVASQVRILVECCFLPSFLFTCRYGQQCILSRCLQVNDCHAGCKKCYIYI